MKSIYYFSITALSCLALGFSGCGGDESTNPTTDSTTTVTINGVVADGYLVGAKVCLDKNYNDTCDSDETYVLTDSTGHYTFTLKEMAATELPIIVEADENTIDLDTNTSIGEKWHFKAMSGQQSFISPLTTLVAQEMEINASLTIDQAMINLQTELGLTDINVSEDYISKNHTQAHNIAKILAKSFVHSETTLRTFAPTTDERTLRLLVAKQIRAQAETIKNQAIANNTDYVCDVNVTDVATQINAIDTLIASALSPALQADLLFMWEEERLARDVYNTLYAKWGSKVFINIATNSEQTHMDSVKSMIDKYQVNINGYEPLTVGVFVNPDLQALYTTLITKGNVSLTEAYKVGVLIEETDISDLNQRLLPTDLPADIRTVYENLRKGSINHLAAFNKQL